LALSRIRTRTNGPRTDAIRPGASDVDIRRVVEFAAKVEGKRRLRDCGPDRPLNRNEALCDRIDGEEGALQSHCSEQRRSAWSDETRSRNLLTIKAQPRLSHGPHLALPSANDNRLLAPWDDAQAVGKITGNHEEGGAAVNEQVNLLAAAGGATERCRYTE